MLTIEKETWIEIINLYKDMPFLWDKKNVNYMNRDKRQEGFQIILDVYKRFDKDATLTSIKKKIENMRTTFNRELKKVKASMDTEQGTNAAYVPALWYFDLFKFLEEKSQPCSRVVEKWVPDKRSESDLESEESYLEESSQPPTLSEPSAQQTFTQEVFTQSSSTSHSFAPCPTNKKQRKSVLNNDKEIFEDAQKLMRTDNEWEIIGKSIGIQLKDIPKKQQIIAQKLISDILFYAKLGKLCEESSISLNTSLNFHQADVKPSPY